LVVRNPHADCIALRPVTRIRLGGGHGVSSHGGNRSNPVQPPGRTRRDGSASIRGTQLRLAAFICRDYPAIEALHRGGLAPRIRWSEDMSKILKSLFTCYLSIPVDEMPPSLIPSYGRGHRARALF